MTRRALVAAALAALVASACTTPDGDEVAPVAIEGSTTSTVLAAPSPAAPPVPSAAPAPAPVEVVAADVAVGLVAPWGLAFLPDGTALVSERDSGRILRIEPGVADAVEVQRLEIAGGQGEGGLLGLAVSRDYGVDGLVYAYHSTAVDNRVVRFRLGEAPTPILTDIPVGSVHNGGRLAFGPDGLLYVSTGDTGNGALAADPASLGGKVLRLLPDGSIPADNPFGTAVWSLGHRNVQGLAWDAAGRLFASEFGQQTWDEVNRIEPGADYGWPAVEGRAGQASVDPVQQWRVAEASPSGIAVLTGGAVPQWEGDLFVAGLRGERLWRLDLDGEGGVLGREPLYVGEYGRLRHVAQAPDGSLWLLTSNRDGRGRPRPGDDRIVRLGPPA